MGQHYSLDSAIKRNQNVTRSVNFVKFPATPCYEAGVHDPATQKAYEEERLYSRGAAHRAELTGLACETGRAFGDATMCYPAGSGVPARFDS